MRMSCNGCRVLRKGCNEDCVLRPCLEWINSPHSQANATLFLAKFYGRAGLFNLIRPSPLHLRPGIFRSLLYEACGRIINPVYGSVGLMSSGSWEQCQSAVDSVLNGTAVMQLSSDHYGNDNAAVVVANCDIRHLSKVSGNRKPPPGRDHGKAVESPNEEDHRRSSSIFGWNREDLQGGGDELNFCSVGTVEPTLVSGGGGDRPETCGNDRTDEVVLELTLGRD